MMGNTPQSWLDLAKGYKRSMLSYGHTEDSLLWIMGSNTKDKLEKELSRQTGQEMKIGLLYGIPVEVRGIFRGRIIREGEFYLVERKR
jgi:hypothetical protein